MKVTTKKVKCGTKRRFATEYDADHALSLLSRTSKRNTVPCRWYYCDDCKGFHLTSREYES